MPRDWVDLLEARVLAGPPYDGDMNFHAVVVDTELVQPREVIARDGDGDGDVDIFVAVRGADELRWYENLGHDAFAKHLIADGQDGAYAVIATDFDGDGDVDVIGANKYSDTVPWFENDGTQAYAAHVVSTEATGVRYIIVADVDSDSDLDVIAALAGRDHTVWYENGCENQVYAPQDAFVTLGIPAAFVPGFD